MTTRGDKASRSSLSASGPAPPPSPPSSLSPHLVSRLVSLLTQRYPQTKDDQTVEIPKSVPTHHVTVLSYRFRHRPIHTDHQPKLCVYSIELHYMYRVLTVLPLSPLLLFLSSCTSRRNAQQSERATRAKLSPVAESLALVDNLGFTV